MYTNEITQKIIEYSIKIHKSLGPGLLESAYQECLFYELQKNEIKAEKEKSIPLVYESIKLESGFRIDLFVENKVIVEIKSVEKLNDVHLAQILTYLKLTKCRIGLLINFNTTRLVDGLKRVVND